MKSFNRRVEHLGDHLYPTEIVLRWLQESLKFDSMNDLVEALAAEPDGAWPLHRLTDEAERAAKASTPDMPQNKIDAKVRDYVRDAVFLWCLHMGVNGRIDDQVRQASGLNVFFISKVRARSRGHSRLSNVLEACRDLAYPLDAETAAAVAAALEYRVVSWNYLRESETIEDWIFDDPATDEKISDEELADISHRVERAIKSLVRSKAIRPGKIVRLSTSPIDFLGAAPLIDGRWIDAAVLELAEMGAILADGGFKWQESADPHPLAWHESVKPDQRDTRAPIDEESWLTARRLATARVRAYRGRRRAIDNRDYVELSLYQRSRKRSLRGRLDACTEDGFVASDWNEWVNGRAPAPAIAGIRVQTLDAPVDADDWTVHDAGSARRHQIARATLIDSLLPDASDGDSSGTVGMEGSPSPIPWQDGALEILVRIEGLVRAINRIRAHYFRNHEIVYADHADSLDCSRTGIHLVLSRLEEQNGGNDSWIARLIDPSISDEDERVDPEYAERERGIREGFPQAARTVTGELALAPTFGPP
ncbi:MAG: hypothetical protein OXG11_03900, partial [Chloroflexi bacterium]|nr:hypothetical protein [Chloroflexota bacterium]